MAEPRTAAATQARKANARRRRLRNAAALLRAEGFIVEPPNLDAALLINAPAGSAHGAPDHREED
jgi:hypothetical protein